MYTLPIKPKLQPLQTLTFFATSLAFHTGQGRLGKGITQEICVSLHLIIILDVCITVNNCRCPGY